MIDIDIANKLKAEETLAALRINQVGKSGQDEGAASEREGERESDRDRRGEEEVGEQTRLFGKC